MKSFFDKYWCNDNFGICYPLLKEIDSAKPIKDQLNYNNAYGRYWKTPVLSINGKKYIMCSQWFKQFREKLDRWINMHGNGSCKSVCEVCVRDKERCIHYDFKKDQCLCVESAVFAQGCENVDTCKNYNETRFQIYIVPKSINKSRRCPCCNNGTEKEFVICTYKTMNKEVKNQLLTYRCNICEKNFISDTLYANYTRSKDEENLDVTFERII